jgi:hypothetical protein
MVELHFEPVGPHLRFLPRRFSRQAERSAEPEHASSAHKRKPEYGEWNGKGKGSPHEQETRAGECSDASPLAHDDSELAGVGARKQTRSE